MNEFALLAALAATSAVLVRRPPGAWVMVRVRPARGAGLSERGWIRAAAPAAILSVVVLPAAPTILAWTAVAVAVSTWRRLIRVRARREADRVRERCTVLLDAMVTEVRSGATPAIALARVAGEHPGWESLAHVAAACGDVPAALTAAAAKPGADDLAAISRAWSVSEVTGAPLGGVLERLREAAREDREIDREVAAGVAPARATATLMAGLPILGFALGSGLGVDPLAVVLHTVPGALCVAVGTGFALAGVAWIDRIADAVEQR